MAELRLIHPFTLIINGTTGSGKSYLIFKLINERDNHIRNCPKKIIFFYSTWQKLYDPYKKKIDFVHGVPDVYSFKRKTNAYKDNHRSLVVIDDSMLALTKDIAYLFTVSSHHQNASIILVTHNIFLSSPIFRTIALNTHCLLYTSPSPRDKRQSRMPSSA